MLMKDFVILLTTTVTVVVVSLEFVDGGFVLDNPILSNTPGVVNQDNSSILILRNDVAGANMAFFWKPWRTLLQPMNDSGLRYWIGLERLHELTQANCAAVFDIQASNGSWYRAAYTNFRVADAADNFRLHIGGYSGNAGDAMAYHNSMSFSTYDRDNDLEVHANCAGVYWGAFWFNNCFNAAITVWPRKYFYWFVPKFDKTYLNVVEMRLVC